VRKIAIALPVSLAPLACNTDLTAARFSSQPTLL
jgi:hypothetical protein